MDKEIIETLRKQYMANPPDGLTKTLIKNMSDNDLLDLHDFVSGADLGDYSDDDISFEPDFHLTDLCLKCQKKLREKFKKWVSY
jgi:hypothetical protein